MVTRVSIPNLPITEILAAITKVASNVFVKIEEAVSGSPSPRYFPQLTEAPMAIM